MSPFKKNYKSSPATGMPSGGAMPQEPRAPGKGRDIQTPESLAINSISPSVLKHSEKNVSPSLNGFCCCLAANLRWVMIARISSDL
jgi:hypothetical protein